MVAVIDEVTVVTILAVLVKLVTGPVSTNGVTSE